MQYRSTRSNSLRVSFEQAIFQGMPDDGGLFIPEHIPPPFTVSKLQELRAAPFEDVVCAVLSGFISDQEVPKKDLKDIAKASFSAFPTPDPIPLNKLEETLYLGELFHGPTLSFKDIAMQFLGNLIQYFLAKKPDCKCMSVLGATSGDTGSAAIHGFFPS